MSAEGRSPVVALIHGTPAAMSPAEDALADAAPGLRIWHLLDDRLMAEASDAGGLTPELERRMSALIEYALAGGADAVQLTCSQYGAVADGFSASVPVRASDAAMLSRVADARPAHVGVLASLPSAAADSVIRVSRVLGTDGVEGPQVTSIVIEGALALVGRKAFAELSDAAVRAVGAAPGPFDILALAQYSLAPIADRLREATGTTVLSPAQLMAQELRDLVDASSPAART